MERWSGRVALVTGASVGIGAAICKVLVRAGMNVVGAARVVEKIQELSKSLSISKGSLTAVKCDLTKEEGIRNLFEKIKQKFGGVDVCVNNAGFSFNNSLMEGTPTEWKNMMDVNVISVCLCSKLAIQSMRERGVDDGHIINVSRQIISPGRVETEFAPRRLNVDPEMGREIYGDIKCLQAEDIALSVLHIISAPAHVEINDIIIRPTEESL